MENLKKCLGCGKVYPARTDVCDKCGGMNFLPYKHGDAFQKIGKIVEPVKKEEINKEEIKKEEHKTEEKKESKKIKKEEK